ncbi:flagellar basal-body rod protein FlgF [Methylocystis sp. WRRC1]|uniref:flagellar basal-body rod protein FlgF n=1 Tax=unclassified Methylocystis TaxID=2625913 RepID=UPI0001F879EC|nr:MULTISPECIES: flagellar basal-body rod protein FlgF [unclassified Methylocystis]MCC3245289.1 flagellar basal-body rod protein FlgF [Methylocystis sp. WRRC1]
MHSAFYVSLSSQITLDKRLTTIAANVANSSTIGYRATGVSFDTVMSKTSPYVTNFPSTGVDYISRSSGGLTKTDNPLDVAVIGDAWFAIRTPQGVAYTRDGRMRMMETGDIQTILGYPVLDAGNSPIKLDPTLGPPMIYRDGMITQGDRQVGAIGLFEIDGNATLQRGENSSVIPSTPAIPVTNFTQNGMAQGHLENANVNPVSEITKLIMAHRSFESASASYDMMDNSQRAAVRTLGGA